MDFSTALNIVKEGGRVRRPLWRETEGKIGSFLELLDVPRLGEVLVCQMPDGSWHLWTCSQWDILADDWEEVS